LQESIKKRPIGRRGGASWGSIEMVQLICEQLVNGTPPSAIPGNITAMFAVDGIVLKEIFVGNAVALFSLLFKC